MACDGKVAQLHFIADLGDCWFDNGALLAGVLQPMQHLYHPLDMPIASGDSFTLKPEAF